MVLNLLILLLHTILRYAVIHGLDVEGLTVLYSGSTIAVSTVITWLVSLWCHPSGRLSVVTLHCSNGYHVARGGTSVWKGQRCMNFAPKKTNLGVALALFEILLKRDRFNYLSLSRKGTCVSGPRVKRMVEISLYMEIRALFLQVHPERFSNF